MNSQYTEKLVSAFEAICLAAFNEFSAKGGRFLLHDRVITMEDAAQNTGLLPVVVHEAVQIADWHEIDFFSAAFVKTGHGMTGAKVADVSLAASSGPALYLMNDFVRNELLKGAEKTLEIDFSDKVDLFKRWLELNVQPESKMEN